MDNIGSGKYTILPKQCIDLWVESVGIPELSDDVSTILAEDVAYRVREAVHNAMRVMKHCKRSCLGTDDFNRGLNDANTQPIYGHGGTESVGFKSVSLKDERICYVDEKEVNLRDIALEPAYPADAGEVSVKANWLVLEGHLCSIVKPKEEPKNGLKDPVSSYLGNVTAALIGTSDHLRRIALKDLMTNSKLQVALPHLVSFFSLQVKHHTDKDSFVVLASYVLLAINALVENPSILLTPYVFQLVKIMLFIVVEAHVPPTKWIIKDKAAHVLAHLCRKQNLHDQLLKSYQDNLTDESRPLQHIYGALVGVRILGVEAVETVLYPILRQKLSHFVDKCETAESEDEIIQLASLKSAFTLAVSLLIKSRRSHLFSGTVANEEVAVAEEGEGGVGEGGGGAGGGCRGGGGGGGVTYTDLFDALGEQLLECCSYSNHEPMATNLTSKLPPLTKINMLNINKPVGAAQQLVNTKLKELKQNNTNTLEKIPRDIDDIVTSNIVIKGVVSCFKSKKRRVRRPHEVFLDIEEDVEVEVVDDVEDVPCKKRKTASPGSCTLDAKFRGAHLSYRQKQNRVKDLTVISNFLPIL